MVQYPDMAESLDARAERIASLRAELAELEGTVGEEVNEVITDAEESVAEVAETNQEEVSEAAETVNEAATETHQAIEEESREAASELGHPELAGQIADELERRMEARGLFPERAGGAEPHAIPETVHQAEHPAETVEAGAEEVKHEADTPPTPAHWYYRKLGRR